MLSHDFDDSTFINWPDDSDAVHSPPHPCAGSRYRNQQSLPEPPSHRQGSPRLQYPSPPESGFQKYPSVVFPPSSRPNSAVPATPDLDDLMPDLSHPSFDIATMDAIRPNISVNAATRDTY